MTKPRRPVPWWFLPLAATPLAWVLNFAFYVLRARIALGRWPEPRQPDPKDLGFVLHHTSIFMGAITAMSAVAFAGIFFVIFARMPRYIYPWTALAVFLIGTAGLFTVLFLDPGAYVAWFMD